MSDANLQVGIESGQAVSGSKTVIRSINDIYNAANTLDTKLRSMESSLGKLGSNPGLTQAKAAIQSLQSPLQSVKAELERIESRIIRIGVTAVALGVVNTIFGRIKETLSGAIKAVDDFQISVISIAASLTQIRVANGETDLAGAYQKSSVYAGQLALKLQEVDKNSFANYKGLMAMLQVMTAQGQVLDINNKKQVDAFTNLSNAIAIMTPGQDQQMQMYQETRAIMSGVADRHSQVARMLDQQIKAQGIYKGGLKEIAALGRQHGDTIERIAPYLRGIGAASGDIAQTWSTVVATFETALNFIQRMAFGPIVKDLTQMVSLFSDLMKSNSGGISDAMANSWSFVKDAVFDIDEKTKKLKFSPEFLDTLKLAADIIKGVIDSFAILIKWVIKYSDEMKTLLEVYLAYKVISLASLQVNKLMAASQESLVNAMIARQTALARLGIIESSSLTIQQQSVLASRESLLVAAQEATASATKQAARQAEVASINAAAQAKIKETAQTVENVQVRRWEIGLEQEAQAAKISGLRLNAELLVQERLLAESRVASASAYANASIAANGKAWSTEAIAIEKAERDLLSAAIGRETAARMALESTMIRLSGLEAEEISLKSGQVAAEQAVLSAKIRAIEVDSAATTAAVRHNVALLALGETTGFVTAASLAKVQTDYLRLVEQDRLTGSVLAATAVETAHTEAIAMNTAAKNANSIANQALTASTNLLQGALALIGGPIGALIIAIGALTYAWVKLTEAEEVNRSKKNQKIFDSDLSVAQRELDEVNKKLAEAKKLKDKKTDPVKFEADEEQDRLNKMMITETRLRKELADAEKSLRSIRVGGASVARDEAEERVRSAQIQVDYFRKVSDATAKGKKELEEYNKETMKGYKGSGKGIDEEKGKKSESEKAMDRLINGYQQWQQIAIRTGKVEDELGAKILGHQNAVKSLMDDTAKAKGPQADAIRASIDALLAETIAIEKNLDAKKRRFEVLDQMQEKERTNNADTLRSAQLLHAKGIIDDQQYLDAQLLSKQAEIDIQKKYLDQKLQVMQDLNINTKDKADLLLALEKNENAALAGIDAAELARIADTNKRKSIERQKDLDDFKRKSEEYQSVLSLQVAQGNISSSDATQLGTQNELSVLYKQRSLLEDKGFNDVLSVTELQQVIQELENIDTQITIVQNKVKSFAADQGWAEGIKRGFKAYSDDISNLGKQMQSAVTDSLKSMEDALVDFVKTGKLDFKDLADTIITHMIRIMVQQTAMKAISGIGSAIMGMFGYANGGAFESGVQKFAKGGVVNSPTIFPMAKGMGLMGEDGPEAVMPLTRTPSGKLGVETTGTGNTSDISVEINIENKSNGEVKQGNTNWKFDGKKFVINTIIEDVSNNGPLRGLMASGGNI